MVEEQLQKHKVMIWANEGKQTSSHWESGGLPGEGGNWDGFDPVTYIVSR
jgi:hypothetical protein